MIWFVMLKSSYPTLPLSAQAGRLRSLLGQRIFPEQEGTR